MQVTVNNAVLVSPQNLVCVVLTNFLRDVLHPTTIADFFFMLSVNFIALTTSFLDE
jgi:hypothetical protein